MSYSQKYQITHENSSKSSMPKKCISIAGALFKNLRFNLKLNFFNKKSLDLLGKTAAFAAEVRGFESYV